MRRRNDGGFTLVELMVTLSIAVILLAVAVPSFHALILNGRRASVANELVLALTYAKSEAVKRGIPVTLCSKNPANTTCGGSTTWDNGWLVFVDNNKDGVVDTGGATPDLVLQTYSAPPSGITLRAGRASVTFRGAGSVVGFNNTTFSLCDSRGASEGRGIVVSSQGRVRTDALLSLSPPGSCP